MRKYLEEQKFNHKMVGYLDLDRLFRQIDQIVLKTIISAESMLWNGVKMFLPNTYQFNPHVSTKQKHNNCFELLGFDILLDSSMKPWLLEVNLSPSLNVDSPLDFDIKGKLIKDLFNLVGLQNEDH